MSDDAPHIYSPGTGMLIGINTQKGQLPDDLSAASALEMKFRRNDGSTFTRTATISGTDPHKAEYVITSGDFDPGTPGHFGDCIAWVVATIGGNPLPGDPIWFTVREEGVRAA